MFMKSKNTTPSAIPATIVLMNWNPDPCANSQGSVNLRRLRIIQASPASAPFYDALGVVFFDVMKILYG